MKTNKIISWGLRITVAAIFLQTLYYKFTGHPDSVYIFSKLGAEPYGRFALGVAELVTSILILLPRTKILGILLSFGIICGAIFSHLLVIGTEIEGDSGGLFLLALVVLIACIVLLLIYKTDVLAYIKKIFKNEK